MTSPLYILYYIPFKVFSLIGIIGLRNILNTEEYLDLKNVLI